MVFELISEGFNRHSEDLGSCLGSNKSGLASAGLRGKEIGDGELILAFLSPASPCQSALEFL